MTPRERFLVTLRPEPGVAGLVALRGLLKVALRRFGLRCIRVEIVLPADDAPNPERRALARTRPRRSKAKPHEQ